MIGYLRKDGRKGIRNNVVLTYQADSVHHIAQKIISKINSDEVSLIGFPKVHTSEHSLNLMKDLCTHPNIGGVVILSLESEQLNSKSLYQTIKESGRCVEHLVIPNSGATKQTIKSGVAHTINTINSIFTVKRVDMKADDLIIDDINDQPFRLRTGQDIPKSKV